MTYLPTEEDLALLKSRSKRLYCRIELLNKDYQIIDTIDGLALSGSNSIDADSDTRRTFNLDIFPKSGFSISQFSTEEWTSKMLRLQIGMKAPTSMPLVGADAVRIPEEEIDAKIKNSAIYKEKDTELRQAKWRYKVGGYEQYGNIENINRKRIIWTDENKEKYASFVKEQGDVGTYSTVVASSDGYTTNGKTYEIAYTPLLIGGGDVVIPLLNADIRSYIEVIFNAACDAVQRDGSTLQSKILELDSFGVDCTIYGKTIRVKNMIAAVEGGIAAGRILSAADVAAIAGCTKEELDKYFHDTSVFVGYSMHDIQGTIWELKDGLTQIYNFYHALYSGEAEIRTGTNFVDTDGVHWYGAGVYAIQQNGYSYDATTNKLSLSCLDMTCLLDGTLGGTLTGYATRIPMYDRKLVVKDGVNYYEDDKKKPHYVRDSIKETFELSGLTKSMVDYWVRRIPHDLEYNTGTTIWNILTELRDLYFPFEMYFDDDTFVCKEIPSGYDDPVVLDEDTFKSMVISEDASVDYGQIHNCVEVWGASNSSDYFCKDKLEKNDPDGTGEVVYCKKGTKEWNDVVTLLKDNKLNMSYNMNPNDTGASILLLKLKQASIQDGTRFSFICPEDIAINARICVENLVTTIKTNPTGAGQYRETTRAVYGPMMLFKAVTNEKGEDEPEDTSLLRKGRYYVIKYGEHWLNQATDGAFTYKFNALTGKYEKEQRDPQVRYYPKQIYNPSTKNYDTVYVKYNPATNTEIQISDPALLIESRVYFIGQSQSHAMTKFVDAMPTAKQIEADKIAEACDNLEYVVVNDPNRIDDLYNSRLTIDKIGRRNLVCSGSEFDGYTSDESAMTVCKYTLWKNCRLTDSITLSMHMIPWLDVNEKVKYAAKYLKSDIAVEWIIKKIDKNIGEGTMNVTLSRYYPYYPYITYENVLKEKYIDNKKDT